ncbi:hypothetical protein NMG60_11031698 [Bertholletia excelsa]
MYPSSSSSSSQGSMGPSGLTRYGSAPGSLLATAVDSVITGAGTSQPHLLRHHHAHFIPPDTCSDSTCKPTNPSTTPDPKQRPSKQINPATSTSASSTTINLLQRSFPFSEAAASGLNLKTVGAGESNNLIRHSSSPAGFLSHLTATAASPDNGFSVTRGIGNYNSKVVSSSGSGISRLNSQLSFTRQDCLSHISEESDNVADDIGTENSHRKVAHSYATASASFRMGSWDDTNSIMFSAPPNKRAKNVIDEAVHGLNTGESQIQFSLPQTNLEMATMENLLHIPHDSVPCKVRAKRGCATHPRSIAERERRTRISGKLKKLQDLVPNMDKQTSYADMLDLAVQHIKGLQNQIQKLNLELENCTCGCKQTHDGSK